MQALSKYTFRYFLSHMGKYKFLTFISVFGICLGVLGGMATSLVLKELVDVLAADARGPEVVSEVFRIFWMFVGVALLDWFGWRISGYFIASLQSRTMKNMGDECFERLHQHSFNFFNNQFVGSLVKRVNRMVRAFEEITDQVFFQIAPMILRVAIVIGVLFYLDFSLGIVVLVWTFFYVVIHASISRYKLYRYDLPKAEADTAVTAQLADTITNHSTIQLFSRHDFENKSFQKVTDHWREKVYRSWVFNNHVESIQGFAMSVLNFVILYLAIRLWQQGELTVGHFVLIQSYLWELYMQLWDFGRMLRHFYEHMADANEMSEILLTPLEVKDVRGAKELKVKKGEVTFDHVSFSYTDDEESSVVKGLSFTVKPAERIALIGPSGGGKTTIVKLLLRLFDVDKGAVLIDGQDISKVSQASLRRNIALVPQDPILFHRSLMENIRYGNLTATDEDVIKAAKLAHCHEFISKLPQKYQTHVGERGVKLSGGERQRVAIARAILANTKILVLDEATSSLDSESEKLIKDALKVLMKGKTVFVIAHRLSTIVDMDRILVLEKGKIVEEGDHKDLVKKEGGLYKKLWDLQVGGYLD